MTSIAELFRTSRKSQGLTLEEIAEQVGLTTGALSHIENGRRLPSPENAVAIGQVLGLAQDMVMQALDEAHRQRRYQSLASNQMNLRPRTESSRPARSPRFEPRDIGELVGESPSMATPCPTEGPGFDSPSLRDAARWSRETSERLEALDQLAEDAARAIRTLRGLLEDEDPEVRREARRLLRELDVRLSEE